MQVHVVMKRNRGHSEIVEVFESLDDATNRVDDLDSSNKGHGQSYDVESCEVVPAGGTVDQSGTVA